MASQSQPVSGAVVGSEPSAAIAPHLLPAFVVLSRMPGANTYQGVVEHSFSMGRDPDRVLICWSHKSTSSPILNVLAGERVEFAVDGEKQARHIATDNAASGEELTVWDVTDPALPITIDWAVWDTDNEPCETTLSGVRNKYRARNAPFVFRDSEAIAKAVQS